VLKFNLQSCVSQHCVVISLAKNLAGTTGKVERANVLSLDRVRKKDGRRLDRFYVIICMNATQLQVQFIIHFLPVSPGFHFHTHMHSVHFSAFSVHYHSARHGRDVTLIHAASRI
jgi:hypothetical protein